MLGRCGPDEIAAAVDAPVVVSPDIPVRLIGIPRTCVGGRPGVRIAKGGSMAEELAFARKASGLVRGLSMVDAFAVGMMNQGITPSI